MTTKAMSRIIDRAYGPYSWCEAPQSDHPSAAYCEKRAT